MEFLEDLVPVPLLLLTVLADLDWVTGLAETGAWEEGAVETGLWDVGAIEIGLWEVGAVEDGAWVVGEIVATGA